MRSPYEDRHAPYDETPVADGLIRLGVCALAAFLAYHGYRYLRAARSLDATNQRLDESLAETFPASDPPASQDFSSPDDRGT